MRIVDGAQVAAHLATATWYARLVCALMTGLVCAAGRLLLLLWGRGLQTTAPSV